MPPNDETYYKLLEDDIKTQQLSYDNEIQLSIAISLKRIADKLELSQKQPIVMNAEEALKYDQSQTNRGII